jgi:ribonuclease P protein component
MPKKYRLSGEELRGLSGRPAQSAGKRIHGRFFSLLVVPVGRGNAKCACVVSKKTAAKAVDRNSIKRRFRNILATRIVREQKPLALVFSAKRDAGGASFAELEHDIDELFSKL